MSEANYKEAAKLIKEADHVLLSLGNGFNLDGDLKDFTVEVFFKDAPNKSEMPQANWYVDDPSFDLGYFAYRYKVYNSTEPNSKYQNLKDLLANKDYFVTTACTEGFAHKIFPSEKLYEVHGCIRYWQCTDLECTQDLVYLENLDKVEYDEKTLRAKEPYLTCPTCKSYIRPNICLTNDWNFKQDRIAKQIENFNKWVSNIKSKKNPKVVILEIGAGLRFPTIRENDQNVATELNATLIRINLGDAEVSKDFKFPSISLKVTAKEAIEEIEKELKKI